LSINVDGQAAFRLNYSLDKLNQTELGGAIGELRLGAKPAADQEPKFMADLRSCFDNLKETVLKGKELPHLPNVYAINSPPPQTLNDLNITLQNIV
jgi:hypothetical protein